MIYFNIFFHLSTVCCLISIVKRGKKKQFTLSLVFQKIYKVISQTFITE